MLEDVVPDWDVLRNLTYKYVYENFGREGLLKYYRHMANSDFYKDVIDNVKKEGLKGVKRYWENSSADDGTSYNQKLTRDKYSLEVNNCMAFKHFRDKKEKPFEMFCDYCMVVNSVIADKSNLFYELKKCDKKGKCKHIFYRKAELESTS